MLNFFDMDIIPTFLSRFKVEKVLLIGLSNKRIINEVVPFCINRNILLGIIDLENYIFDLIQQNDYGNDLEGYLEDYVKYFEGSSLEILPTLESYDAIFIEDDPNWYTMYSELNLIKKFNSDFPLVFVCNNKYPHNRRDSYINPQNIPENYRNDFSDELPIEYIDGDKSSHILLKDGLFHAVNMNTPKNGVLTAIEDFLNENYSLNVFEINPFEGISLIYENSSISYIRISQIMESKKDVEYNYGELSDKVIENNIILNYISKLNLLKEDLNNIDDFYAMLNEKNIQIGDYKDKIQLQDSLLDYKDSQITNVERQLSLKQTQIQGMETVLFNKSNELSAVQNKLEDLENIYSENKRELESAKKKLVEVSDASKNHDMVEQRYTELIEIKDAQLDYKEKELESAKKKLVEVSDASKNHDMVEQKYTELIEIKDAQLDYKEKELESAKKKLVEVSDASKNHDMVEQKYAELIEIKNAQLNNVEKELESAKKKLVEFGNDFKKRDIVEQQYKEIIESKGNKLNKTEMELKMFESRLKNKNNKLDLLKAEYIKQSSELNHNEYCIHRYKEKMHKNNMEIQYLKKSNKFIKKLLHPFSYLLIVLESDLHEIGINIKLYKALKNGNCFDIGYYLNKYPDILKSKWCKYFSPELHFVCKGFNENRKFNEKVYNHTKHELFINIKDK